MTTLLMNIRVDMDDDDKLVDDFVEDHYDFERSTMVDTENVISQLA